jgi:hypothetical protein
LPQIATIEQQGTRPICSQSFYQRGKVRKATHATILRGSGDVIEVGSAHAQRAILARS